MSTFPCKFFLALGALSIAASLSADERRTQRNNHWGVLADFVYLRRSHSSNKGLAYDLHKQRPDCVCDFSVLRTKKLINTMDFEPGYRVALLYRPSARKSLEANFLYLEPWKAHAERSSRHDSLLYPFHLGSLNQEINLANDPHLLAGRAFAPGFFDADQVKAEYNAHFWDAELNSWHHFNPRWSEYFSLSGVFGLRYFHYQESLEDVFYQGSHRSMYNIRTKNQIGGAQIGLDLQVNPMSYMSWDFCAKVGIMADFGQQRTLLRDHTHTLRHFSRRTWQDGVFADCAGMLEFNLWHHLNLHAGYQFLFLSGIVTAEDQLSQKIDARKRVNAHGVAMIHGLFAGLVLNF